MLLSLKRKGATSFLHLLSFIRYCTARTALYKVHVVYTYTYNTILLNLHAVYSILYKSECCQPQLWDKKRKDGDKWVWPFNEGVPDKLCISSVPSVTICSWNKLTDQKQTNLFDKVEKTSSEEPELKFLYVDSWCSGPDRVHN